jgi:rubrerythrin
MALTDREKGNASLRGTKTHQNLKEAFAVESQANPRYLQFAGVAEREGQPEVAGLFRGIAEGETRSAHGHLDYLKRWAIPRPISQSAIRCAT